MQRTLPAQPVPRRHTIGWLRWLTVVVGALVVLPAVPAQAQVDFLLRRLLGVEASPAPAPDDSQLFTSRQLLQEALAVAEAGELERSCALAVDALKHRFPSDPVAGTNVAECAEQVLLLSDLWHEKKVDAKLVAATLLDIVLPLSEKPSDDSTTATHVRPFIGTWDINLWNQSSPASYIKRPRSLANELMSWSVQTGELAKVRARLPAGDAPTGIDPLALGLVRIELELAECEIQQIAEEFELAERQVKQVGAELDRLRLLLATEKSAFRLEAGLVAVSSALREPECTPPALALLDLVLTRLDEFLMGNPDLPPAPTLLLQMPGGTNWLRLHAAAVAMARDYDDQADRFLTQVIESATKPRDPQQGAYLRQLHALQAGRLWLEGGRLERALERFGQIADEPPAEYRSYYPDPEYILALGWRLEQLPAQERYDVLLAWSRPTADRPTWRELTSFVPPGELPHTPSVGGAYSTLWHLARTAREVDRLDELQKLVEESLVDLANRGAVLSETTGALVVTDASGGSALVANPQALPPEKGLLPGPLSTARAQATALQALLPLLRMEAPGARTPTSTAASATALAKLSELTQQSVPDWNDSPKARFPFLTYVVAAQATATPSFQPLCLSMCERMIEHTQRLQSNEPRAHVRLLLAELMRQRGDYHTPLKRSDAASPGPYLPSDMPARWQPFHPRGWLEAGVDTCTQRDAGTPPGIWTVTDGFIQHMTGTTESLLHFEWPLSGSFDVTFEGSEGNWSEGSAGFGGAVCSLNGYINQASLRTADYNGYMQGPTVPSLLHTDGWNRWRIEVRDGTARYFVNGQWIFEDACGTASPWLALCGDNGRNTTFRNFVVSGTPTIPHEVRLLSDARLRGWTTSYYQQYMGNTLEQPTSGDQGTPQLQLVFPLTGNVWRCLNEELQSNRFESLLPLSRPSLCRYLRPLSDGDTLHYEYLSEPGVSDALLVLGESIIEFTGEGLTTRPLPGGSTALAESVLAAHKPVVEQASAATHLPRAGWNVVQVRIDGNEAHISWDGQRVGTVPLESSTTQFGFYHDAAESHLRVRNVVLTGRWSGDQQTARPIPPEVLADLTHPQATQPLAGTSATGNPSASSSATGPGRRFLAEMIHESRFSDNAATVYRHALTLPSAERYALLREWVLPGPTHATLRLSGGFTQAFPTPMALESSPLDLAQFDARATIDQVAVPVGGSFQCPAILLALTAAEVGQLDALIDEIGVLDFSGRLGQQRAQAAMLGICLLLHGRSTEVAAVLRHAHLMLSESGWVDEYDRWSELALCSLTMLDPSLQAATLEVLDKIQREQLESGKPGGETFHRYVRQLHGQARYALEGGDLATFGANVGLTQWRGVSQTSARSAGQGYPLASFDALRGDLNLRGGHDTFDVAYFQSPLEGDFELRGRLTAFDWREVLMLAGGVGPVMLYDQDVARLYSVRAGAPTVSLLQPIVPKIRTVADYAISIRGDTLRCTVNGQLLHERTLPAHRDPWLGIGGSYGHSSRFARGLTLSGSARVPKEIDLLGPGDLTGWMLDYYADNSGENFGQWSVAEGELSCPRLPLPNAVPGRVRLEDIARYHRPMLEDGDLGYEFYCRPGTVALVEPNSHGPLSLEPFGLTTGQGARVSESSETSALMVHPALGRMVFLISPEGVDLHWLTDGRHETSGLTPGNVQRLARPAGLPPEVPLPLKQDDWNSLLVRVRGATLQLELNGVLIAEQPIHLTCSRHFGLFHYANETGARVRNVRWRGDWPQQVPSVAQQQLAPGPERLASFAKGELPAHWEHDFRQPIDPQRFAYHWNPAGAKEHLRSTPRGLLCQMAAGQNKVVDTAGLHPRLSVHGNFVSTVDYQDFSIVPTERDWGCGISMKLKLRNSDEGGVELRSIGTFRGTICMWFDRATMGQQLYRSELVSATQMPARGRLRLSRRGTTLYYLTAVDDGPFQVQSHREVGDGPIDMVCLRVECSDQTGGVEALITRWTIDADRIEFATASDAPAKP